MQPLGHTIYYGYGWRRCPFSLEYKAEYYDNDLPGPSSHPSLFNRESSWTELPTAAHTTTSGSMTYKNNGVPGFICWDTACPHYTTVQPGVYYWES